MQDEQIIVNKPKSALTTFDENLSKTPAEIDPPFKRRHSIVIVALYIFISNVLSLVIQLGLMLLSEILAQFNVIIGDNLIISLSSTLNYVIMLIALLPFCIKSLLSDTKKAFRKPHVLLLVVIVAYLAFMMTLSIYSTFIEQNIINLCVRMGIFTQEFVDANASSENQQLIIEVLKDPMSAVVFIPSLIFIGPLCEEIVFRKAFFRLINSKKSVLNIIITGLIFGAIHVVPAILTAFLYIVMGTEGYTFQNIILEIIYLGNYVLSGVMLGLLYSITGYNFVPAYIIHILNNTIATLQIIFLM